MDKLKPCPFCGGEAEIKNTSNGYGNRYFTADFSLSCKDCGLKFGTRKSIFKINEHGKLDTVEDGYNDLVESWNRRKK